MYYSFRLHDLSDGPQIPITHQSRKTNIHDYFISTYFRRGIDLLDEGVKEAIWRLEWESMEIKKIKRIRIT